MFDPNSITPAQALFYLQEAIKENKLDGTDIRNYQGRIKGEITSLEQKIAALKGEAGEIKRGPGRPPGALSASARTASTRAKPIRTEYNLMLYSFPVSQRKLFSAMRKSQGEDKALELMKSMKTISSTPSTGTSAT